MQVLNGHETVLVHREAVGVVADDERVNRLKFRQERREQAQRVHRAQRLRGMGSDQNLLQVVPELGAFRRRGGQRRLNLLDLVLGGRTEAQAVARHESKHAQR